MGRAESHLYLLILLVITFFMILFQLRQDTRYQDSFTSIIQCFESPTNPTVHTVQDACSIDSKPYLIISYRKTDSPFSS